MTRRYSYSVFPLPLIVLGYGLFGLALYSAISTIDYTDLEESSGSIIATLGFIGFGLLLVTFRGYFTVDQKANLIIKEYRVFGSKLSLESIKIPSKANEVLILPKTKRGKSYITAVIPFSYKITSYDVYFRINGSGVQIIKTDLKRAVRIAELIKSTLNLDYTIKE